MKLRVGVVGLGKAWETRHGPALRALSDRYDLRAICEPVAHRAEQIAREFKATPVDGFRALLDREDIDAILLLSAQWYGSLPILAACESGKAVYCAAALDMTPEQAQEVKTRVEEAGIAFMSEFPCRQAPATLRLKELIATHLGPPRLLFCHKRRTALASEDPSTNSDSQDLMEIIDWCRYVVGSEPTSVLGVGHQTRSDEPASDYEMMNLDFSEIDKPGSGVMAQISSGRYIPADWPEAVGFRPPAGLQIACERGIAFIDLPTTLIWFDNAGRHMEALESERPVGEQLLLCFHRSVTSLVRNTSSLDDAYRAHSILVEAERSHAEGRRIALDF